MNWHEPVISLFRPSTIEPAAQDSALAMDDKSYYMAIAPQLPSEVLFKSHPWEINNFYKVEIPDTVTVVKAKDICYYAYTVRVTIHDLMSFEQATIENRNSPLFNKFIPPYCKIIDTSCTQPWPPEQEAWRTAYLYAIQSVVYRAIWYQVDDQENPYRDEARKRMIKGSHWTASIETSAYTLEIELAPV